MVLTSTNNDRDFDTIAAALLEQHSKAHMSESRKTHDHKRSKGYGKGFQRYGNYSNSWEEPYEEEEEDDDEDEAE
eukprot:10699363-Karenia_brevis.AAC.1